MPTDIVVISGFLGAGKTTLIQKLLKEAFQHEKVALIENDFGEISVDAALLQRGGVEVKEMNSGCICCSLSGDFVKALRELIDRFDPDKIIIEPSGVGKLSDIVKACADRRIQPLAKITSRITVVDVKRCNMYLDNFGEFFEDQIQNADTILLSRAGDFPDKVTGARQLVKRLNADAAILTDPLDRLSAAEILNPRQKLSTQESHGGHSHHSDHEHEGHSCGGHHGHGHSCSCGHDHSAEEIFDTVTVRTKRAFSIEELKARVLRMTQGNTGTVLRAKGIVRGTDGYLNLQYLPGDLQITGCAAGGDMLCIIGRNLNRQELVTLFNGK